MHSLLFGGMAGCTDRAPDRPSARLTELFEKAFIAGFAVVEQEPATAGAATPPAQTIPFKQVVIGQLEITSGGIVAADPFVNLQRPRFTQVVPNGVFPVTAAVAAHPSWGDREALVRVDFSAAKPVRWQMALIDGQDVATLKPGEVFGYGVDAGTGSFADATMATALEKQPRLAERESNAWLTEGETWGKRIGLSFALSVKLPDAVDRAAGRVSAGRAMMPGSPGQTVIFHSGFGDGFYASYFGFAADGAAVALITDFAVVDPDITRW